MLVLLMGVFFFKLRRLDGLRCRDIRTKFHKDCFRHSKVNRGGGMHRHTHRQQVDLISLLLFFQNDESRLKRHCIFAKERKLNLIERWMHVRML
jgi:hypothetical protein